MQTLDTHQRLLNQIKHMGKFKRSIPLEQKTGLLQRTVLALISAQTNFVHI